MGDCSKVVWKRRPRVLLTKLGMLVLDAFEGHLTLDVRSVIHALNTDLVVIAGRMTS
jgi:hypothetical protein